MKGRHMFHRTACMTIALSVAICAPLAAQTIPADTDFQVKLLTPVNTQSNNPGVALNPQVISPAAFAGDIL